MDILVSNFIDKRILSKDMDLNEPLYNAILYLEKCDELIRQSSEENLNELIKNVSWPSMHDMYSRNYEYCCGVISCFLVGQFPSVEALCRTAIEGAVNLHYVSLGDSIGKQIAYFKYHLITERKQNQNWKTSIERSEYPKEVKEHHLRKIKEKYDTLDFYESSLRESLNLAGINFDKANLKWPSIFDRFKEIGNEVGYRTVYAALCSQAHNDAEDILNKIMSRIIDNVSGLEEAQWIEQYNFSLYLLLTAIDYHLLASAMYIAKFSISPDRIVEYKKEIMDSIILVAEHGSKMVSERIEVNESL